MKLKIENININNHHLVKNIASIAGYAASLETVEETSAVLNLMDVNHRKQAGIKEHDVQKMLDDFVIHGFTISRIE